MDVNVVIELEDVMDGCGIDTDGEDSVVIDGGINTGGEKSVVDGEGIETNEEETVVDEGVIEIIGTISLLLCR